MSNVVVLECNEIPLRIFEWYRDLHPDSAIARLLNHGRVGVTHASDEGAMLKELYPSQTWATLAMGVPFEKHGVYWYGDPKPPEYPLYWQIASAHRRVGVINTLHSSPFADQCQGDGMVFALPDVFAMDNNALPSQLQPFQAFTRGMTTKNGRAVRSTFPAKEFALGLAAAQRAGVRPATFGRIARLVAGVAAGRIPKERFRTAQFVLSADIFLREMEEHEPDLAVFFTNHVAAAMHRYWPALFPNDWETPPYPPDWVARFNNEIPEAMHALERLVGNVLGMADENGSIVLVLSSMGQVGGAEVESIGRGRALIVKDPQRFGDWLGVPPGAEHVSAMVPHLTYRFANAELAESAQRELAQRVLDNATLLVDRSGDTLTITYGLQEVGGDELVLDGVSSQLAEVGVEAVEVEEAKSGVHDAAGTIIAYGGSATAFPDQAIDVLEVAPAILRALGIDPMPHHVEPTIRL